MLRGTADVTQTSKSASSGWKCCFAFGAGLRPVSRFGNLRYVSGA